MKGKKLSDQHKFLISKSLTNKKKSNETKLKISLSLKNNPNLKNYDKKYKPLVMTDKDNNIIKDKDNNMNSMNNINKDKDKDNINIVRLN